MLFGDNVSGVLAGPQPPALFLEVGPGNTLSKLVQQQQLEVVPTALASLPAASDRSACAHTHWLGQLAALWRDHHVAVDWAAYDSSRTVPLPLSAPTYPVSYAQVRLFMPAVQRSL